MQYCDFVLGTWTVCEHIGCQRPELLYIQLNNVLLHHLKIKFTSIVKDHLGDWSPEKDCCL